MRITRAAYSLLGIVISDGIVSVGFLFFRLEWERKPLSERMKGQ